MVTPIARNSLGVFNPALMSDQMTVRARRRMPRRTPSPDESGVLWPSSCSCS